MSSIINRNLKVVIVLSILDIRMQLVKSSYRTVVIRKEINVDKREPGLLNGYALFCVAVKLS